MAPDRRVVLAGLLGAAVVVAAFLLWSVVWTVFFAITVAYVLYPLRQRLVARGHSPRVASAVSATAAFLGVVALLAPLVLALYSRRRAFFDLLDALPATVPLDLGGTTVPIDVAGGIAFLQSAARDVAVDLAAASPVIALKATLFAFVLYALLLNPMAPRRALFRLVPPSYHDVLEALHDRARRTLYAIYVVQAATAAGTFVVAFVVFFLLGYESPFTLAVVAGILQFVPIVGPSILVIGLAAFDVVAGAGVRALLVAFFGLVFVGFLPDAVIRPKLAGRTAHLPASVYFIGFTGGALTVGVVGVIAGPLAVALLVEAVALLSDAGPPASPDATTAAPDRAE